MLEKLELDDDGKCTVYDYLDSFSMYKHFPFTVVHRLLYSYVDMSRLGEVLTTGMQSSQPNSTYYVPVLKNPISKRCMQRTSAKCCVQWSEIRLRRRGSIHPAALAAYYYVTNRGIPSTRVQWLHRFVIIIAVQCSDLLNVSMLSGVFTSKCYTLLRSHEPRQMSLMQCSGRRTTCSVPTGNCSKLNAYYFLLYE